MATEDVAPATPTVHNTHSVTMTATVPPSQDDVGESITPAAVAVVDIPHAVVDIPHATPILGSWLHVGAEESVAHGQRSLLMQRGVTHVVSTMKHPPPWLVGKAKSREGPLPFAHLHIKVEDTKAADMTQHFDTIAAFIARAKQAKGRVIVHCAFGQSRSVTAAVAYLVACEGLTLGEALERIRSRRPKAHPNPSFLIQLVQHEIKLRVGFRVVRVVGCHPRGVSGCGWLHGDVQATVSSN
jgi:protein-tyrosine phosphatase